MSSLGIWFRCRGCGGRGGYFPDGYELNGAHICPGGVTHDKPAEDINVRPVPCALWQRASAEEYWALHQDDERIEGPERIVLPEHLPEEPAP